MSSLSDAPVGYSGTIIALRGESRVVERLAELGFAPGHAIQVVGVVCFGEPVLVEVKGGHLALRRSEASCVEIA